MISGLMKWYNKDFFNFCIEQQSKTDYQICSSVSVQLDEVFQIIQYHVCVCVHNYIWIH